MNTVSHRLTHILRPLILGLLVLFAICVHENSFAVGSLVPAVWTVSEGCASGSGSSAQSAFDAWKSNYITCNESLGGFTSITFISSNCGSYLGDGTATGWLHCGGDIRFVSPYNSPYTNSWGTSAAVNCPDISSFSVAQGGCVCPDGYTWSGSYCVTYGIEIDGEPKQCPRFGNPIYPLTGSKKQDLDLGFSIGGEPVKLTYDTISMVPEVSGLPGLLSMPQNAFGLLWESNLHRKIALQTSSGPGAPYSTVELMRGAMRLESAGQGGVNTCDGASAAGAPGQYSGIATPTLQVAMTGSGSSGSVVDGSQRTEEVYDASGNITAMFHADGRQLNFMYASGLLTKVTDQFNRSVSFAYEQPSGVARPRVNQITEPDGSLIAIGYDGARNMSTLTWSDQSVRTFVYEDQYHPWALTGIVDESQQRYSTYSYDGDGRPRSTELAGGVNRYSLTYSMPPYWSVTETQVTPNFICRKLRWQAPVGTQITSPNAQASNLSADVAHGIVVPTSQDQPAGSGCLSSTSNETFDANGNTTSLDDFNGNRSCHAYDLARNVEIVRLEGLAGGASGKACPSNLGGYSPSLADPAHPERKTTTAWHPDWVLKTREAEPKKLTTWVYNGQPDPIAGGTAACVTPATTLPDGKPLAVLCARYEQATTDTTGAQGLSATVTGATRAWTYTYNQYGQVLTATTPKQSATDTLSHTTTYAYYADTSLSGGVGHTLGDLQTVTNPRGQVTSYTSYDAAGRLLSSTDPNGTVTANTYWPRGWLKTQAVTPASGAAQLTSYAYYPTGLLQTVTLPDGTTLNYAYDTAHRLTDVTDAAGNTLHYTLDNSGNRTGEQVKDASGVLASTVTRVFDNLNRVQSVTGAMQ
jgi:YD repeat-containing protein